MTRKRTIAQGVLKMPGAMADAALAQLTPDQVQAITPTQAATIHQLCACVARFVAFALENPDARVVTDVDGRGVHMESGNG